MGLLIGVGNTKPTFPYDYYYGVEWDITVSNPKPTRVGKMELHKELPLQNMMRNCILDDNGKVVYYLNANDSTKRDTGAAADLTGKDGMMEIFETAAAQMALLFAMIAVGFGCRKKGVMNDEFDAKLSFLVLNVTMPCMIVAAVLNSTSFPSLDMVLEIIEWGSITYLFVTLIAIVIGHFVSSDDRTRGTLEYLMVFSNVSVIGFPLLNVIFGPEAVVYGAIFNIPSTLATWTIGVMLLANKKDGEVVSLKARLKKLGISLISPCMISCLVSVVLVLCNITDSGVSAHTLTTIGQFTLPGAMFLAAIAIIPSIFYSFTDNTLISLFGGTSVLIMVGVALETVKQIESQMMMRHYKGFLD